VSAATGTWTSLLGLDPETYVAHPLHGPGRTYAETNCYTDILIEFLHARGDEPRAALGGCVRTDFEGDQWTFFKPPPEDLERLFGVDIHEMQPYRSLPEQIEDLIGQGRTLIVELDAWYLPDTESTSYRSDHVKTSVVAEAIDRAGERLRYFHNTGLHELGGEDYRGAFRIDLDLPGDILPPYTEIVRLDAGPRLAGDELLAAARERLGHHLARRPRENPFARFGARLAEDLPDLLAGDTRRYHDYAFATVRMVGAAFELLGSHAEWLLGPTAGGAGDAMARIVGGSKVLSFRLARRKPFDPGPVMEDLAGAWDEAMAALDAAVA